MLKAMTAGYNLRHISRLRSHKFHSPRLKKANKKLVGESLPPDEFALAIVTLTNHLIKRLATKNVKEFVIKQVDELRAKFWNPKNYPRF